MIGHFNGYRGGGGGGGGTVVVFAIICRHVQCLKLFAGQMISYSITRLLVDTSAHCRFFLCPTTTTTTTTTIGETRNRRFSGSIFYFAFFNLQKHNLRCFRLAVS